MFVGDKGKILTEFCVENPRLIPKSRMNRYLVTETRPQPHQSRQDEVSPGMNAWIGACRGERIQSQGSFLNAWPISEPVNLYAVAERTGQRLLYDSATGRVTNLEAANRYLSRQYRKGWDIDA